MVFLISFARLPTGVIVAQIHLAENGTQTNIVLMVYLKRSNPRYSGTAVLKQGKGWLTDRLKYRDTQKGWKTQ